MSEELTKDSTQENEGVNEESSTESPPSNTETPPSTADSLGCTAEELSEATAMGWKDPGDFKGDTYRTPREFIERGKLLDTISSLRSEVKGMRYHMEDLLTRTERKELEKDQTELKKLKREAISNGDAESVEKIDNEIDKVKEVLQTQTAATPKVEPAVTDFVERNKGWFNNSSVENVRLSGEAEQISNWVRSKYPNFTVSEELNFVEAEMKKAHPEIFNHSGRAPSKPAVATSAQRTASKPSSGYNANQITPELRRIAHDFVNRNIFKSTDAYYKSYFNAGAK